MKIRSLILNSCPGCKNPTIVSNFAIMATMEGNLPRIHLMFHCEMCHTKFQGKLDSEDFYVINEN